MHFVPSIMCDQFSFRPTGSTTSALIFMLHHPIDTTIKCDYVYLIALDFSKSFDTVRHSSLLSKIANLAIRDGIIVWTARHYQAQRL